MIKFEKVSYEQFKADVVSDMGFRGETITEEEIRQAYDNIELPYRATRGSAGYDFHAPFDIFVKKNSRTRIYTGIRCIIDEEAPIFLALFPRSGLSNKYGMQLCNTTGIVDSDYYEAKNEGHIMAQITTKVPFDIHAGDRFAQGIFMEYWVTSDDDADGVREGGFGSTGV